MQPEPMQRHIGPAPSTGYTTDDSYRTGLLKLIEERDTYRQQCRDWNSDPAKRRTTYTPPCFSNLSFTEGLIKDRLQFMVDNGIQMPEGLPDDIIAKIPDPKKSVGNLTLG